MVPRCHGVHEETSSNGVRQQLGRVGPGDSNTAWGTTDTSQIAAKILDHSDSPTTRPTVQFNPFLIGNPPSVLSIKLAANSPTNAASVPLTVTFSKDVTG